ncbi:unnamed protein product [Mycena citricolor]|uniref:Uncharacterized protein n=1 Tax=Mycena citricolor TaxID=2018698 RepID=A0AAD2H088_9AGAR|nr:unnamed protein product [Mycena citricolor]
MSSESEHEPEASREPERTADPQKKERSSHHRRREHREDSEEVRTQRHSGARERTKSRDEDRDKEAEAGSRHHRRRRHSRSRGHSDPETPTASNPRPHEDEQQPPSQSLARPAEPAPISTLGEKQEAAYGPEFLRAIAAKGDEVGNFQVLTGRDALQFTQQFIEERARAGSPDQDDIKEAPGHEEPSRLAHAHSLLDSSNPKTKTNRVPPVVFAIPRVVEGAGRMAMDLYMSWNKSKTTPRAVMRKKRDRNQEFLDNEFRNVKGALDKAFEAEGDENVPAMPPMITKLAKEEEEKHLKAPVMASRTQSDPLPLPSSFPLNLDPPRPSLGPHRGSVDSLASVQSMPFLGAVRNVPNGNRLPLRVTNMGPGDRFSMSSSTTSLLEVPGITAPGPSQLRETLFKAPPSPIAEEVLEQATTVPRRAPSVASRSSHGSSKSREKITIVLLDKADRELLEAKPISKEVESSWHGLERRLSSRPKPKPKPRRYSANSSPWAGPVAHRDENIRYVHTPPPENADDYVFDDSDDGDGSVDGTALAPVMQALGSMGYLSPEASYIRQTTPGSYPNLRTPYGSPYSATAATATVPYSSPYVPGVNLTVDTSTYTPSPYSAAAFPLPPSRPITPTSSPYYAYQGLGKITPPQQTFSPWSAPAQYPPTNYSPGYHSSPIPSIYAPSPASVHSNANLAAVYASPYVSPVGVRRAGSLTGFAYGA